MEARGIGIEQANVARFCDLEELVGVRMWRGY